MTSLTPLTMTSSISLTMARSNPLIMTPNLF
jgi:hypothetical protein